MIEEDLYSKLAECTGFDCDEHNAVKIWERHEVAPGECEELFLELPLIVADDTTHSQSEPRFYALGRTVAGRRLFVVFTVRGGKFRVVSARDRSRKERKVYESQ